CPTWTARPFACRPGGSHLQDHNNFIRKEQDHMELPRGGVEAQPLTPAGELAHDSGGQVQPRYQFVPRQAGRLACGEVAIEPVLGLGRVTSVTTAESDAQHCSGFVHVAWSDDESPCP